MTPFTAKRPASARQSLSLPGAAGRVLIASLMMFGGQFGLVVRANPSGGKVVAGQAAIAGGAGALTVTQTSNRAVINWQDFSIAAGEVTRFVQPSATSATLNRVLSGNPSSLLGSLQANGRVYVINPNGVLVGAGARIDTAGFLASTLDTSNQAFLAGGDLVFSGNSTAAVQNLGAISASSGDIFLIAQKVENRGVLSAPQGTAALAAGSEILLTTGGAERVFIRAASSAASVVNAGEIAAATAELKAANDNPYALAINNSGLVRATGTEVRDGKIWLVAGTKAPADAKHVNQGAITNTGTLAAVNANGKGGWVETSGETVSLGAGKVRTGAGGQWLIDPTDLTIDGDLAATTTGSLNAGTDVTLEADNDITVAAAIAANGAGSLSLKADIDRSGAGTVIFENGITISNTGTGNVSLYYNPAGGDYTTPTDYSGNLSVTGGGVARAYLWVHDLNNLQAIAGNLAGNYALSGDIDANGTSGWSGGFAPIGDLDTPFTGIFEGAGHTITGLLIYRPSSPYAGLFGYVDGGTIQNVGVVSGGVYGRDHVGALVGFNSGTILNSYSTNEVRSDDEEANVGGLVGSNRGTITSSWSTGEVVATGEEASVGGLSGSNNGTITQSYASGGISGANTANAGGLVGIQFSGTITRSYSTATVRANGAYGTDGGEEENGGAGGVSGNAGGLVGSQGSAGTITHSYATGAVYSAGGPGGFGGAGSVNGGFGGAGGAGGTAGGLVGNNAGSIENSYAAGAVSATGGAGGAGGDGGIYGGFGGVGGAGGTAGGLAGVNTGSIEQSYATGAVSAGGGAGGAGGNAGDTGGAGGTAGPGGTAGGLAGLNEGNITQSYAEGRVSAVGGAGGAGGRGAVDSGVGGFGGPAGITGGLAGAEAGSASVTSSYWNTQTTGQSGSAGSGATGLTNAQLQDGEATTVAGFDLAAWSLRAGRSPILIWQLPQLTVSGTLTGGSTQGLSLALGGVVLATTTTDASGNYTFTFASEEAQWTMVLIYSDGVGAVQGNRFLRISDPTTTGVTVAADTVWVTTDAGSLYPLQLDMNHAKGGLTSAGILFSAGADNTLILNTGVGLKLDLTGSEFYLDRELSFSGHDVEIRSAGTVYANSAVKAAKFTLSAGDWRQNTAELPEFAVTDFVLAGTGATFLRATGGNGSTGSPYKLRDIYGLQGVATLINESFVLANDIDASGTALWNDGAGFRPIGYFSTGPDPEFLGDPDEAPIIPLPTRYAGTFDGAGFSVTELTINRPSENYVGLFGSTAEGSVVRHVGIVNATITGDTWVGSLVGYHHGTVLNGFATGGTVTGQATTGGLIGDNSGMLLRSYSTVAVTGFTERIGGLAGYNNAGTLEESYAAGSVTAEQANFVGGLAGQNGGIIVNAYSTGAVSGGNFVGGLVGQVLGGVITDGGTITTSYTTSTYTAATGSDAGNVAGGYAAYNGFMGDVPAVTDVYFNNEVAAGGYVAGTGLTLAQLKDGNIGTVAGFDPEVWSVKSGRAPTLRPVVTVNGVLEGADTQGLSLVIGGQVITTTTTDSGGAFTFTFRSEHEANTLALIFADGGGTVAANRVLNLAAASNNPVNGVEVVANTVWVQSAATNLTALIGQLAALKAAQGDAGILFGTGGGAISLNPGVALWLHLSATSFDFDAALALSGHDLLLAGDGALNGNSALAADKFTLVSGNWIQNSAVLPEFAVKDFTIETEEGATFLRATGGDGLTAATAYALTDIYGVQGVGTLLDSHFKLANDIVANAEGAGSSDTAVWNGGEGFNPISGGFISESEPAYFTGSFDGQGHTITGLTMNRTEGQIVALFGYVNGETAVVKNLGLVDVNITGSFALAGLVGALGEGLVSDSYVTGTVTGLTTGGGGPFESGYIIGGLIGLQLGGTVTGSHSTATVMVDGDAMYVGGLIGAQGGGIVTASYATGAVTVTGGAQGVGGLIGAQFLEGPGGGSVDNSYATGAVTVGEGFGVGGLIGAQGTGSSVTNSYSTGAVLIDTEGVGIGGLVGYQIGGSVATSYSTSTVTVNDAGVGVGGLVGYQTEGATIANSYATGAVTAGAESTAVGGLVGYLETLNTDVDSTAVTSSYASGLVTAGTDSTLVGGLIGFLDGDPLVTSVYWDSTVNTGTGIGDFDADAVYGIGGTAGRTTVQLKDGNYETVAGFDSSIWSLEAGRAPRLLWQLSPATPSRVYVNGVLLEVASIGGQLLITDTHAVVIQEGRLTLVKLTGPLSSHGIASVESSMTAALTHIPIPEFIAQSIRNAPSYRGWVEGLAALGGIKDPIVMTSFTEFLTLDKSTSVQ